VPPTHFTQPPYRGSTPCRYFCGCAKNIWHGPFAFLTCSPSRSKTQKPPPRGLCETFILKRHTLTLTRIVYNHPKHTQENPPQFARDFTYILFGRRGIFFKLCDVLCSLIFKRWEVDNSFLQYGNRFLCGTCFAQNCCERNTELRIIWL